DINKKINELRQLGYGYKRIANELSMKPEAVRYICQKYEQEALIGICKNCGLEMKSVKGKKRKTFCSDKCRWQWWNKQRKGSNKHEAI
ncbi:MAG: hypothetical protein J7L34_05270, partial [Thermotogaceae bacterium]|nr:hypothetical protein [Thermotogaceae bacterium]